MHLSRQHPLRVVIALLATGVCAAGCSGSGADVNIESMAPLVSSESSSVPESSQRPSSSTPVPPALSTAPTSDAVATESADRAAAQAQWIKSWDVYLEISRTPSDQREELAATVTVDPTRSRMLADAEEFDRQGLQTYGRLGHRISWPQPINGSNRAVIDDCQDASQSGSMEVATGNKVTVGVAGDHYQGSLVRGDDGVWRVAEVFYLKDEPC